MSHKIVGISGSPVKEGNVDVFLKSIMDLAREKGLGTEEISLSEKRKKEHLRICIEEDTYHIEDHQNSGYSDITLIHSREWGVVVISPARPGRWKPGQR